MFYIKLLFVKLSRIYNASEGRTKSAANSKEIETTRFTLNIAIVFHN
jgi:hypothetical protein